MATTKKHWTAKLASDLIPKKVFDESAQTVEEIADVSGWSRQSAYRWVKSCKDLEQVWKQGKKWPVPAYRIKK